MPLKTVSSDTIFLFFLRPELDQEDLFALYIIMAPKVMAYTVMACIVMAYIVMAYTVMAFLVMIYTVMAITVSAITRKAITILGHKVYRTISIAP